MLTRFQGAKIGGKYMLIRVYFYTPLNRHETRSRLLPPAIQHVTGLTNQPFLYKTSLSLDIFVCLCTTFSLKSIVYWIRKLTYYKKICSDKATHDSSTTPISVIPCIPVSPFSISPLLPPLLSPWSCPRVRNSWLCRSWNRRLCIWVPNVSCDHGHRR